PATSTGRTSATRPSGCCSEASSSICGGDRCAPPISTSRPLSARRSRHSWSVRARAPVMPLPRTTAPGTAPAPDPMPTATRHPHLLRPLPYRLHRGGDRPAGAGGHHGDALRRLRRRRMVRVRLPGMGPDLLGVVADPRPDLHDLRGAGLRSVDADALGAAPDA